MTYKYDIAFSFTQADEPIALKLYNLLKDRFSCFIYSESQKEIAGTDGEKTFNKVFGKDARIVVIFYRDEYGKTKWTRIEETAIKNRAYEDGYDFVILIPTKKGVTPPPYYPKTRLWIGLDRWGLEGAASAIETRALEQGGEPKDLSIADMALIAEEQIARKKQRALRITLEEALSNFKLLNSEIQDEIKSLSENLPNWNIRVRPYKEYQGVICSYYGYTVLFYFYQQYANSLNQAFLSSTLYKGSITETGQQADPFEEVIVMERTRYDYFINDNDEEGWREQEGKNRFYTNKDLAKYWISQWAHQIVNEKKSRS